MAHYTERHLKDAATEDFLKSRGYVLLPHTHNSLWGGHSLPLHLSVDDIITNDDMLITAIYNMGYIDGREEGKMEAVTKLQQLVYATVFPPEIKNVEDEPTYA